VALSDWEPRPPDTDYYAERTDYVRMGDLFQEVPLDYPWPPDAVGHDAGRRKFAGFDPHEASALEARGLGELGHAHAFLLPSSANHAPERDQIGVRSRLVGGRVGVGIGFTGFDPFKAA
jgi:hypothetical protein